MECGEKLIPICFTFSDGLTSLFTLGLLGGGLSLYSPNRRKDFTGTPVDSVDRQGYYGDPYYDGYPQEALSYAQRVNNFENRVSGRLLDSLRGTMSNARKITSRYVCTFFRSIYKVLISYHLKSYFIVSFFLL